MEKIENEYFALWFRLNYQDCFLIWILNEPESVWLDEQGFIPVFSSETELATFAKAKNLEIVNEEPELHDLDAVEEWLQEPAGAIDCSIFLGAWNMFTDVAYALHQNFSGDQHGKLRNRIYDKLFWGNNLFNSDPILGSPTGTYYIPQWSVKEKTKIARVLADGLAIFKSKAIKYQV